MAAAGAGNGGAGAGCVPGFRWGAGQILGRRPASGGLGEKPQVKGLDHKRLSGIVLIAAGVWGFAGASGGLAVPGWPLPPLLLVLLPPVNRGLSQSVSGGAAPSELDCSAAMGAALHDLPVRCGRSKTVRLIRCSALAAVGATAVAVAGLTAAAPALASPRAHSTFLGRFHGTKLIASTVPGDGDINPYGVAVIRHSQGRLHQGDILVSNFNNSKNLQGTGSTIVEVSPSGHRILFARISSA